MILFLCFFYYSHGRTKSVINSVIIQNERCSHRLQCKQGGKRPTQNVQYQAVVKWIRRPHKHRQYTPKQSTKQHRNPRPNPQKEGRSKRRRNSKLVQPSVVPVGAQYCGNVFMTDKGDDQKKNAQQVSKPPKPRKYGLSCVQHSGNDGPRQCGHFEQVDEEQGDPEPHLDVLFVRLLSVCVPFDVLAVIQDVAEFVVHVFSLLLSSFCSFFTFSIFVSRVHTESGLCSSAPSSLYLFFRIIFLLYFFCTQCPQIKKQETSLFLFSSERLLPLFGLFRLGFFHLYLQFFSMFLIGHRHLFTFPLCT